MVRESRLICQQKKRQPDARARLMQEGADSFVRAVFWRNY